MRLSEWPTWVDEFGVSRRIPSANRRMSYPKYPDHAALRAFVHRRDRFTCQHCGRRNSTIQGYDGRFSIPADDGVSLNLDHRQCWRYGGTHHPDNLQVLCEPCNSRKVSTHDRFGRAG